MVALKSRKQQINQIRRFFSTAPNTRFGYNSAGGGFVRTAFGSFAKGTIQFHDISAFPIARTFTTEYGDFPLQRAFWTRQRRCSSNDPRPYVCRLVPECRVESGRADRPFHRPLNQRLVRFSPQAAFLSCSSFGIRCVAAGGGFVRTAFGSFAKGNYPSSRYLRVSHSLAHSRLSTGTSPSNGPFGPASAAARSNDPRPYVCRLVPEYYSPIRFLTPRRPEFRSRLYPHLPRRALGRCLLSVPPFRLRVPHHLDLTFRSDDTRPPWVTRVSSPTVSPAHTLGAMGWNQCAFAPIVRARPFPIFGRPVHPRDGLPSITTRWFSSCPSDPPRGGRPALQSFRSWLPALPWPYPAFAFVPV